MPDHAPPQPSRRRLLIVRNPASGSAGSGFYRKVMDCLAALDVEVEESNTGGPGEAELMARGANLSERDLVVAAGGDGTVGEVLNGLAQRADWGQAKAPGLAVIPLGTANVLARELALPSDSKALAALLAEGSVVPIRFGRLSNGRLFSCMAGAGFDAEVVAAVSLPIKAKIGKAAYLWAAFRLCFRSFAPLAVEIDGRPFEAAQVIVSKGRNYAGAFVVAPEAELTDERLHVCLFTSNSRLRRWVYGLALAFGSLQRLPDYKVIPGSKVKIRRSDGTQATSALQGDGDIVGRLPVDITLADQQTPVLLGCPGSSA